MNRKFSIALIKDMPRPTAHPEDGYALHPWVEIFRSVRPGIDRNSDEDDSDREDADELQNLASDPAYTCIRTSSENNTKHARAIRQSKITPTGVSETFQPVVKIAA